MPFVASHLGCAVKKAINPYATFDMLLFKEGSHWGFAEYRRRKHNSNKFKTIMLSKHKFVVPYDMPAFFVVEWDDVVGIVQLDMDWAKDAKLFERTTNKREGDRAEDVVWIPVDWFTLLPRF